MNVRMAAGAVVVAMGLAGCSGTSEPIETPETVGIPGTALPIPGEGATNGPVPTEPMPTSSPAGSAGAGASPSTTVVGGGFSDEDLRTSVAFVREYLAAYNAAVKNPGRFDVQRFALASCTSCAGLGRNVSDLARAGARQSADGVRIVRIRPDFAADRAAVVAQLDQPASNVLDRSGKVIGRIDAETGVKQSFFLTRSGAGWKIAETRKYVGVV